MSVYQFRLPDLGEGITEGEVTEWLVSVGDWINEDDPLVEITTDKATVEIPSPVTGQVVARPARAGERLAVGETLVEIELEDTEPSGVGAEAGEVSGAEDQRMIKEPLLDNGPPSVEKEPIQPGTTRDSLSSRRTIAARLSAAASVPTVTNVEECEFDRILDRGVSPLHALAYACVKSLLEHPMLNAWVKEDVFVPCESVNLGIATQTDVGLVVPVVFHAETLSMLELADQIDEVTTLTKAGRIRSEQLRGSSFTITSAGRLAGLWSTPLLNLPEVAILGLYKIADRPVVRDGGVVIRKMGNLSITFDHRFIDGMQAAQFLASIIARLES